MLEIDDIKIEATEKILSALKETAWDAIVLFGIDNAQYAGGAFIPFLPYRSDMHTAVVMTKSGKCAYVCPQELVSTFKKLGRLSLVYGYENNSVCPCGFVKTIAGLLNSWGMADKKIAVDLEKCSHAVYAAFSAEMKRDDFEAADEWIAGLRSVKTCGERKLLANVAYSADHGINGYFHHVMGSEPHSMLCLAEEIRVHAMERGLYESGYDATARVTGHDANKYHWPVCTAYGLNYGFSPVDQMRTTDYGKVTLKSVSAGYWADSARIFSYLDPTEEFLATYAKWFDLRNFMVSIIKPGVKCSEVYAKTQAYAAEKGYELDPATVLGHSVGVTAVEAPFFDEADDTEIKEGMILVISPAVLANGESIQSNDTLEVTADGVKVLNWWKDWREPYIAIADL